MNGLVVDHGLTRSVRDSAALLDATQGPLPGDPYMAPPPARPFLDEVGADPGRLRVGVLTSAVGVEVHPDCVAAAEGAARLLESLGHHVDPSSPAAMLEPEVGQHFITIWATGSAWNLDYWSRMIGRAITADDVEPGTWALASMGRGFSGADYLSAVEWLQRWSRRLATFWSDDGYDLLVTPTLAEPPPRIGEFDSPPENPLNGLLRAGALVPFTPPFNASGQPAISLPLHWSADGLPIGVQLVAGFGREDVLLRVAAQLEAAEPWAARRPAVHA
jgi:amidase